MDVNEELNVLYKKKSGGGGVSGWGGGGVRVNVNEDLKFL